MRAVKGVLVPRAYTTSFQSERKFLRLAQSTFSVAAVSFHKKPVVFIFPGYGKILKRIPDSIIEDINNGEITDIVDIGAGGALDPHLQKGDLVLSTGDYSIDKKKLKVKKRTSAEKIAKKIAKSRGVGFYKAKILTSNKVIISRDERLDLRKKSKCMVVQMEHFWFINSLKKQISRKAFNKLYFTHLEVVADTVPEDNSKINEIQSMFAAFDFCILRNQKNLGMIKSQFLKQFLK